MLVGAIVLGVPTGVIPTPLYTRMTPVLWWNYPVLAISAALLGFSGFALYAAGTGVAACRSRSCSRVGVSWGDA